MDKFNHVVGIIHTNYVMYSQSYTLGQLKGPIISFINQGICRAYCNKIIKLSGALQEFAAEKETVCNVHGKFALLPLSYYYLFSGVREKYLLIGDTVKNRKLSKGMAEIQNFDQLKNRAFNLSFEFRRLFYWQNGLAKRIRRTV
jgi:hypothetical protein